MSPLLFKIIGILCTSIVVFLFLANAYKLLTIDIARSVLEQMDERNRLRAAQHARNRVPQRKAA